MAINNFIDNNGENATLRKIDTASYNEYDELDYNNVTWTETSIKIVVVPSISITSDRLPEGRRSTPDDLTVYTKTDVTISEDDYIVYNGVNYKILKLEKIKFAGLSVYRLMLHRVEP